MSFRWARIPIKHPIRKFLKLVSSSYVTYNLLNPESQLPGQRKEIEIKKMNVIIPLLGTTAAAAAAYFAYEKLSRDHILEEQYKQIGDAAARLSGTSQQLATVLVLGFQNHGRSSFVNTMIRVLYKEEGPLIMRAETGSNTKTRISQQRVLKVKNKLKKLYPKYLMKVIDSPRLSITDDFDDNAIRNVLRGRDTSELSDPSKLRSVISDSSKLRSVQRAPECVIMVMKAEECHMGGPAWDRMPDLVRIIREEGLQFVVVLTHKKEAQAASIDLQDLARRAAVRAGTDFVHCIENYVVGPGNGKDSSNVSNDFDTHNQTLSIVRQCFEYVRQRRQIMSRNLRKSQGALDDSSSSE